MSLNTECDICGKKYTLPSNAAGDILECKECGAEFEIPLTPWWRSLFDEHADSTSTFRSIVTAGCAALVLFLMAIAGYELTRESVTHRNEQLAQAAAPVSPPVVHHVQEIDKNQGVGVQAIQGSSTPQLTFLEPVEEPKRSQKIEAAAPRFPTAPTVIGEPTPDLVAQFQRSSTLTTRLTSVNLTNTGRSARVVGKGLDRVNQVLLLPTGGKPASATIQSRSETELTVEMPIDRTFQSNAMIAVETPEGLVVGYPTTSIELRAKPTYTVGRFYVPARQRVTAFAGVYHLLLLPDATLEAAPGENQGGIATIIALRGARLVNRPGFPICCWVCETGAVNFNSDIDRNPGIRTTLEFSNIYLCPTFPFN